jgi:hypothetical protein
MPLEQRHPIEAQQALRQLAVLRQLQADAAPGRQNDRTH